MPSRRSSYSASRFTAPASCQVCSNLNCTCRSVGFFKNPLTFWTAQPTEHTNNPSKRFIAVEIEVAKAGGGNYVNVAVQKWKGSIVTDNSLPMGGFEINTSPANGDLFPKQIREIGKALDAQGGEATSACGLHVHIDARDFEFPDIARLMLLYTKLESGLSAIIRKNRRSTRYSLPCAAKYALALRNPGDTKDRVLRAIYGTTTPNGQEKHKYNHARYAAMNLHSWQFRGTVECRMFAGTVTAYRIINWGLLWAARPRIHHERDSGESPGRPSEADGAYAEGLSRGGHGGERPSLSHRENRRGP
jgi:hypothetical protein